MATYFHGNSEIQGADGLQTLVLMNPGYVQYSDTSATQTGNYVFLNSASNSLNSPSTLPHAPPSHTQQFVGFPLASPTSHQDPNSQSMQAQAQHDLSALHGFAPRVQYNLWNSIDPNAAARETPRAQQGLSLSLSSQQQPRTAAGFNSSQAVSGEDMRVSGGSPSSASGVTNGMQSVLMSSKYLKAAQELLDEVVNVGNNGIKADSSKKSNKTVVESAAAASGDGSVTAEVSGKNSSELSTVERQEIQMKKAKLITMLDEVEQRYRQYHHQMQIVTSSFEQVAGIGSAKTYTALALETISKQFRCLKDAITSQIRAANKSLGEEDSGGKIEGSRLKFVDHHLRQQRALQQLGMIQHNAWRPQRGLPERSVSVLRAWLFEHFLHPYPKDSDKHMLAKQTGLTRSQVSNWFINARVRLWKPMVEEMYLEELKEQEQNGSEDKTLSKGENKEDSTSMSEEKKENRSKRSLLSSNQDNSINQDSPSMTQSPSPMGASVRNQSVFSLMGSSELEGITQGSPKRARNVDMLHSPPSMGNDIKPEETHNNNMFSMKFGGNERQGGDEYSAMTGGGPTNFIRGSGQYPIGEIGRFDSSDQQYTPRFSGNGVSLTLGLPHCENNLSLSGTNQSFLQNQNISQLGRRVDQLGEPNDQFGHVITTSTPHSSSAYDTINIQNRKRFAAQLLPDFVA